MINKAITPGEITELIRKQLDTVSSKYDELMEKAKIQNNTRFENFFRRPIDNTQNSLG